MANDGVAFGVGKGGVVVVSAPGIAVPPGKTLSTITMSQLSVLVPVGKAAVDPMTIWPLLSTTPVALGAG